MALKMHKKTHTVPGSAEEVCPLLIGSAVPPVSLIAMDGEAFDLQAMASRSPAVLIFYRGGW